jgi:chromosome segregation ATPase
MMRAVALAWIALLIALVVLTGLSFSSGDLSALLQSLSPVQQLLVTAIAFIVIWIAAATAWQARALSQVVNRSRTLEGRVDAFRAAMAPVEEGQRSIESVEAHMSATGPDDALSSLHKRVTESEKRTAAQEGQNRSADLQERLQEMRERQVDLRNRIGEVVAERRTLEPIFSELSDRQKKIESSLSEMELDDNRNSLFRRLEDFERAATKIKERLEAVQTALASLVRLKAELSNDRAELSPLQAPSTGVKPMAEEVGRLSAELTKELSELEMDGDQALSSRVDAMTKSKSDAEHKIGLLDGWQETLVTLRREFDALKERLTHISRSISEIEKDSDGTSLSELIKQLNDHAGETRTRLWSLQTNLSALEQTKGDFVELETVLAPLRAQDSGIVALSSEVHALRDRLSRALDGLERQGDDLLVARVEQLRTSKKEIEGRIVSLQGSFESLDGIRSDVSGLFERLKNALNKND